MNAAKPWWDFSRDESMGLREDSTSRSDFRKGTVYYVCKNSDLALES